MRELIEFVAKTLVEQPDRVQVREMESDRLELRVDRSDVGRVIGRKGRTAQAMRTLLRAMAPARSEEREPELEIAGHPESDAE
jgi:predicted RNA-binding protein YlqC (UPF0109 family)